MNATEKWAEIEWALDPRPLIPPAYEEAPDSEPDLYLFIVTDNSSRPVVDFNCYSELK